MKSVDPKLEELVLTLGIVLLITSLLWWFL